MVTLPNSQTPNYNKKEARGLTLEQLSKLKDLPLGEVEKLCRNKGVRDALLANVKVKVNRRLGGLRTYYENTQQQFDHAGTTNLVREHLHYHKNLIKKDTVSLERYNPQPKDTSHAYAIEIVKAIQFLDSKTSTPTGLKDIDKKRKATFEQKIALQTGRRKVHLTDEQYQRIIKQLDKMRKDGVIKGDKVIKYDLGNGDVVGSINNILIKKGKGTVRSKNNTTYKGNVYISASGKEYKDAAEAWIDQLMYLGEQKAKREQSLAERFNALSDTTTLSLSGITPIKNIQGIKPIQ